MPTEIILYSAPLCGDCQKLKMFMDDRGVPYEIRDIKENLEYARELEAKTGKLGVPYLIVDGEWKRGYVPGQPYSEELARDLLGIA